MRPDAQSLAELEEPGTDVRAGERGAELGFPAEGIAPGPCGGRIGPHTDRRGTLSSSSEPVHGREYLRPHGLVEWAVHAHRAVEESLVRSVRVVLVALRSLVEEVRDADLDG